MEGKHFKGDDAISLGFDACLPPVMTSRLEPKPGNNRSSGLGYLLFFPVTSTLCMHEGQQLVNIE